MKRTILLMIIACLLGIINAYSAESADLILINQVGYAPKASKVALIRANVTQFDVIDVATGKSIFRGKTGQPEYWKYSGDTVRVADFSSVSKPGKYKISIGKKFPESAVFSIGTNLYAGLSRAAIKALYFNRCSFAIDQKYAGKYSRAAGHPDTVVLVHESAASEARPAGTVISSPGGWYDAGDYNKYIVNSGISTYTLLLFCQMYPAYCKALNTNIPESGNAIPDPLDEALYNLRWMLTMQDPNDGGVYHKLTNKNFDAFIMPEKATTPRYVVQKTTSAALDFAAVMAMAYRLFSESDVQELKDLSTTCLNAANRAYAWAKANPHQIYKQPSDVVTGTYGDNNLSDEFFWASAELALSNKNPTLITKNQIDSLPVSAPSWGNVRTLGILSLAFTNDPGFKDQRNAALAALEQYNKVLLEKYRNSPYRVSLDFFHWGSNSDVANQAMLKIVECKITGNRELLPSIQADADYILGRNATGYCFVTGFGSKTLMNIHHRPSGADGIPEPIPGFLSGGPNVDTFADCGENAGRSKFPAKSFMDSECSYSTNEIAINWNAPLFFLMGALDDSID
ncbi:MAG TPA: glycoside hydrolase family 9 protein [Bacteroidales bacterium]|nr:glycoside hydrolase family 9 protein [Bacteroidales bacterium]